MPIQLDKILNDIANEKVLHPNYIGASKNEIDAAWVRVGKSCNLSVHESRSIFKVLQKKYEQEKTKERSLWKLYGIMDKIHKNVETNVDIKEEDTLIPLEDDEEYETVEVHEEDESPTQHHTTESGSNKESSGKSYMHNVNLSDNDGKQTSKSLLRTLVTATPNKQAEHTQSAKLLNTMASHTPRTNLTIAAKTAAAQAAAASLQRKGVTFRKTQVTSSSQGQGQGQANTRLSSNVSSNKSITVPRILEVGKTIQLPESIKRKLSEEITTTHTSKKYNQSSEHASLPTSNTNTSKVTSQQNSNLGTSTPVIQIKQERPDTIVPINSTQSSNIESNSNIATPQSINVITISGNSTSHHGLVNGLMTTSGGPSSSTAAMVASTSTNDFSPRLEDIDFRNDIIFDGHHSNGQSLTGKVTTNASEIINLGNLDNSLPPTFFKNLCNSSRHEALGLYVANIMNRLKSRSAAKLELAILRAIIEIQNEELEQ